RPSVERACRRTRCRRASRVRGWRRVARLVRRWTLRCRPRRAVRRSRRRRRPHRISLYASSIPRADAHDAIGSHFIHLAYSALSPRRQSLLKPHLKGGTPTLQQGPSIFVAKTEEGPMVLRIG